MEQWNKEERNPALAWVLTRTAFCSTPFRPEQAGGRPKARNLHPEADLSCS